MEMTVVWSSRSVDEFVSRRERLLLPLPPDTVSDNSVKSESGRGTISARRPSNCVPLNKPDSRYTARVVRAVVAPSADCTAVTVISVPVSLNAVSVASST